MKHKLSGVCIALVLILSAATAAAQSPTPSFTVQTIPLPGISAYNMKVSPDGRVAALFTGSNARSILNFPVAEYDVLAARLQGLLFVWLVDLTTGEMLGRLTDLTDFAGDVAFSPDGTRLAAYQMNGEILVWDVASRALVSRMMGPMGQAKLAFLPDGSLVAAMPLIQIGHFFVWDTQTGHITHVWHVNPDSFGELIISRTPENFTHQYFAFAISPDGASMATANLNGEVMLWDLATLEQTLVQQPSENPAAVNIMTLAFSTDGKQLVYFDRETQITHSWDTTLRSPAYMLPIGGPSFALTPQADALAWVAENQLWYARLDNPEAATAIMEFPEGLTGIFQPRSPRISFSPDGRQIIVGEFWQQNDDAGNTLFVITLR